MKNLIDEISQALNTPNDFTQTLKNSDTIWKEKYPIAVIHSLSRAKSTQTKEEFQNLIDEDELTPESYTSHKLSNIYANAPESLQCANFMILKEEPKFQMSYKAKFEKDFWKKIQNVEHVKSSFDFAEFENDEDKCAVEFKLRELIRKRKEVHALKEVGLIWMATTPNDVSEVFERYFEENYVCVNEKHYIGWSDKLKNINMRNFVCPPTQTQELT